MNTTEIVKREVQSNGSFQVRQFLAVGVREPRQPAKLHPHGKVLPLHVAGRNVAHTRIPDSHLGYNLRDPWWGVPRVGTIVLSVIPEQFHKLGEVHVQAECVSDGILIESESVSSELDLVSQSAVQIANKTAGAIHRAFADEVGSNEFGFGIHRHENPLIANLVRVGIPSDVALLLLNKSPDFVALHVAAIETPQRSIEKFCTTLSRAYKQPHDRVPIQPRKTLGAADRTPFQQTLDRHESGIWSARHCVASQFFVRFAEGSFARSTAPTLNAALTKVPKSLAGIVVTTFAGHIGLDFLVGPADDCFASALRLDPRAEHPRLSVSADGGALFGEWARQGLNLQPTDSKSVALGQFELRAHKGDVQGLAPSNVPSSFGQRWASIHSRSPFAWIEHLKSFCARILVRLARQDDARCLCIQQRTHVQQTARLEVIHRRFIRIWHTEYIETSISVVLGYTSTPSQFSSGIFPSPRHDTFGLCNLRLLRLEAFQGSVNARQGIRCVLTEIELELAKFVADFRSCVEFLGRCLKHGSDCIGECHRFSGKRIKEDDPTGLFLIGKHVDCGYDELFFLSHLPIYIRALPNQFLVLLESLFQDGVIVDGSHNSLLQLG